MKVSAEVTIGNGTYDDWLKFFKSYEEERSQFVTNEVIEKTSDNSALVTFKIINLDGLIKQTVLVYQPTVLIWVHYFMKICHYYQVSKQAHYITIIF